MLIFKEGLESSPSFWTVVLQSDKVSKAGRAYNFSGTIDRKIKGKKKERDGLEDVERAQIIKAFRFTSGNS